MREKSVAWLRMTRATCVIAMGLLALWASLAAAQGIVPPTEIETRPTETPATVTPEPTAIPDETTVPDEDPGSGGIVVTEVPGEDGGIVATETPGDPGGLAPGFVTVVLWTSDGGGASGQTTVCVGHVCQSVASFQSGAKIAFDRIDHGTHQVTVRGGTPYSDASSSVGVVQGQGSWVELTLTLAQRPVEEKPTSVAGPIRVPATVAAGGEARAWDSTQPLGAMAPGANDPVVATVNALPATGSGEHDTSPARTMIALGALLLAAAVVTRKIAPRS